MLKRQVRATSLQFGDCASHLALSVFHTQLSLFSSVGGAASISDTSLWLKAISVPPVCAFQVLAEYLDLLFCNRNVAIRLFVCTSTCFLHF